jgi:hypothetical protein
MGLRISRHDVFDAAACSALALGYGAYIHWYGGSFWLGLLRGALMVMLGVMVVYFFGHLIPGVAQLLKRRK